MNSFFGAKEVQRNVGVYIRVSTVEQAQEGFGLHNQEQHCGAMCTVKGWEVHKVYADKGISGAVYPKDRPGLNQLLIDARKGIIDAVVFYKLDRLGRTSTIVNNVVKAFSVVGLEIVSCKDDIDTSTPNGRFMLGIFSELAELDRETIKARLLNGRKERLLHDGEGGGKLPYGYHRVDGQVEINQTEDDVIKTIFDMKRDKYRVKDILDWLEQNNILSPTGNTNWSSKTLYTILHRKRTYLGGKRGESKTYWPAILPWEYDKIKVVNTQTKKTKQKAQKPIEESEEFMKRLQSMDVVTYMFSDDFLATPEE